MSQDFIGSKISLTSKSAIRYVGILTAIDHVASTISLEKVQSFGTENRRPDAFIPANPNIYDGVVFRAQDITDLQVLESPSAPAPAPAPVFEDPAIVSSSKASQPAAPNGQSSSSGSQSKKQPPPPPDRPSSDASTSRQPDSDPPRQPQRRESNLEKVERALGELSASRASGGGESSTRGGPHGQNNHRAPYQSRPPQKQQGQGPDADYSEEYDFQEMNKKFEVLRSADAKADQEKSRRGGRPNGDGNGKAVLSSSKANGIVAEQDESDSEEEGEDADSDIENDGDKRKNKEEAASPVKGPSNVYNKSQSFFDTVSSDVLLAAHEVSPAAKGNGYGYGGRGRGGRGGGGGYRWNRNDQLVQNMSTFGEAGEGLGMGPGTRGRGGGRGGGRGRQPSAGQAPR